MSELSWLGRSARLLLHAADVSGRLADLCAPALEAIGARAAVVFELLERDGDLRAAPAPAGGPPRTWRPAPADADTLERVFTAGRPSLLDRRRAPPELAAALETSWIALVPLAGDRGRFGVLALGFAGEAEARQALPAAEALGGLLALALARERAARAGDLHERLRTLMDAFARGASSALTLADALAHFCRDAGELFESGCISVWLHDRKRRELVRSASSDPGLAAGRRVSTADDHPAARALRDDRARLEARRGDPDGRALLSIPLRGRRRALGVVLVEGAGGAGSRTADLLWRADELGRQLSSAIENLQLLEDVLRARRELENTFDSLTDLVAVCDPALRLVNVNRAFAARLGVTRSDIVDRPLSDFVAPDTVRWIEGARMPPDGTPAAAARREIEDAALNGIFAVTVSPLLNPDGVPVGCVLVARDVTIEARLEAEQTRLRDRLAQAEKLAALGQFVAGTAHELNNPLQGVLGHLELVQATYDLPKRAQRDLRRVLREAERAAKIVQNLLVFAGSRRLGRRRVSVNTVLARALALRARALRRASIEIVREHAARLPRVQGDALLIQQVFLNVILNAEHAMSGGGRLEVRTTFVPADNRIRAELRDTGAGIPLEVLPRVFEPFYTTKDVGQGTGLGLAIAYGIVQEHGGQILVSNHPDGGALVTIDLPVDPGDGERGDSRAPGVSA